MKFSLRFSISIRPSLPVHPLYGMNFPDNILPGGTIIYGPNCLKGVVRGDVEKGFAEADIITEGTFGYENMANAMPAESVGASRLWEEPNKATICGTSQAPYMDKVTLFHVFNRQIDIRSMGVQCGGGFGTKFTCWQVQSYAILLSKATKQPVKVMITKEEHLATFVLRVSSRIHARVGMKKDGTLTAIEGTWYVDTGYYSFTTQAQVAIGAGELMIMAQCPNWDLKNIIVATQPECLRRHTRIWRPGVKEFLHPTSLPCNGKGGLDPFEVLKKNFVKPGGGYYWRDGNWFDFRGIDFSKAMDKGAETFGWKEKWKGWLNTNYSERYKTQRHRRRCSRKRRYRRGCIRSLCTAWLQRYGDDLSLCSGAWDRTEEQLCQNGCRGAPDTPGKCLHDSG